MLTEDETRASFAQAGLQVQAWEDVSELGKTWITQQQQQVQQLAAAPTGPMFSLGWVLGSRMQPMVANFAGNIKEGRIRLVMGICEAV